MELFTHIAVLTIAITVLIIIYCLIIVLLHKVVVNTFVQSIGGTSTMLFFNLITFPGVIHHELSHALLAFLTGAKITSIDIFHLPKNGTLGSVSYIPRGPVLLRGLQMCLTSIAPSLTPWLTVPILYKIASGIHIGWQFLIYYFIISILAHIKLSPEDFKGLLKGLPQLLVIIFIIVSVYSIFVSKTVYGL